ncbi:hypothetical protein BN1423_1230001 [Carnobacterium maltaromaticum]|nr:hypothetical protein BN1423_1230001 [Carnobacterium maltaromaticum]
MKNSSFFMQNFKNDHYVEFLITFLNYSNYDTILIDNYKTIFSDCSNLFTRKLSTLNTASLQRCLPIALAGSYI